MKPAIVADEMFPEGAGPYMDLEEAGGSSALLIDLAANEKAVHADFFNVTSVLYGRVRMYHVHVTPKLKRLLYCDDVTNNVYFMFDDFEDLYDDDDLQ